MIEVRDNTSSAVGRDRVLDRVDRQLRIARDIIIISPPISGLSTFLIQVQRHITTAEHFTGFRTVCLDCQRLKRVGKPYTGPLCRAMLDKLELAPITPFDQQDARLVEFLDELLKVNDELRLVVILDDLQLLPESEIRYLLEQIRVVSESREENKVLKRILFVLGGQCIDLYRLDPERTSPFNIAERIFLDDLDEQEALEAVNALLSKSTRPYSGLAAKYICYLTGNHPYLLEQVCSHLVHDTIPATVTVSRLNFEVIERVVEAICNDGRDRLLRQVARALEELSPLALEYLRNILNGDRYDSRKEAPPLRELVRLGLVSDSKSLVWQVRSPFYDRYLRQQPCLTPVLSLEWFVPRRLYVNLEGYGILFQLENDLRDFVISKLFEEFGAQWPRRVDQRIIDRCRGLKTKELESGWFPNEDLPDLAYSLFPDLKRIIDDNWAAIFHRYFKPKGIFTGYFEALESIRNRIAHNRPLNDQEIEQLDLFASQFRNCMYDVPTSARRERG